MILANGQKAILRKFNRKDSDDYFDDKNFTEQTIKVIPFDVDQAIRFGIYTMPEAKGYYMVGRQVDVREGDQIIFVGKFLNQDIDLTEQTLTVLQVKDAWIFNRIENKVVVVK